MSKKKQAERLGGTLSATTLQWVYLAILVVVSAGLYVQTISYALTELDDVIFIRDTESYNRASGSFGKSFSRGVFSDSNDTYYRPFLLNSFVLDRTMEGKTNTSLHFGEKRQDISRYHITNILLHCISVALLFLLLLRLLGANTTTAFILSLLFAVHPALAQAVAWIPGRNDPLLAVFTLGFLITALDYVRKGNILLLLAQPLLLLAALFSKETGIIAAPMALILLLVSQKVDWRNKRVWWLCLSWVVIFSVWLFGFRYHATVKNQDLTVGVLLETFVQRLPLILQYLGKILLPFNLTVFPQQEDTTLLYGVGALILLVGIIALAQQRNWRLIITGIVWFLAFVFPVLIVPKSLNNETFEHRLYLPIIGILLLLTQVLNIKGMKERYFLNGGIALCVLLAAFTAIRCDVFSDKWKFWEKAVADSPSSANAKMMLGMRYYNDTEKPLRKAEGEKLLLQAYHQNPQEKYLNHYVGKVYLDRGQLDSAKYHYLKELEKNPNFFMTIPDLARVYVELKNFAEGEKYLLKWLENEPNNQIANNNLLFLYTNDLKKPEKARAQAAKMLQLGLSVPDDIIRGFGLGTQQPSSGLTPAATAPNSASPQPVPLVPNGAKP